MQGAKGFISFTIDFFGEDWYENYTFSIPYCIFENGKAKIKSYDQESVPKDWYKTYIFEIKELNNITLFKRFMKAMNYEPDKQIMDEIRNAIKEKQDYDIRID